MKWTTRPHVQVDRVACPWLIARFIDFRADFMFIPNSNIEDALYAGCRRHASRKET